MYHQDVEDDLQDTELEDLGRCLYLTQEKLERVERHTLQNPSSECY